MVIDAPPQLSLVSVNILRAVTELIVPVDAGIYSAMGLSRLQETVEKVRRHLAHPDLAIIGLVVTRAMPNRATKDLVAQLRKTYGSLVYGTRHPLFGQGRRGRMRVTGLSWNMPRRPRPPWHSRP